MNHKVLFAPFAIKKSSQLKTKSDQWYDVSLFLYKNKKYAAALYVGGFVIECLLKSALWERRSEEAVRPLLFGHDLWSLLNVACELDKAMRKEIVIHNAFVALTSWNVKYRYNPGTPRQDDAHDFVSKLSEVRKWLRSRV